MPSPGTYLCLSHRSRADQLHPTLADGARATRGLPTLNYDNVYAALDAMQWLSEVFVEYARTVNASITK